MLSHVSILIGTPSKISDVEPVPRIMVEEVTKANSKKEKRLVKTVSQTMY